MSKLSELYHKINRKIYNNIGYLIAIAGGYLAVNELYKKENILYFIGGCALCASGFIVQNMRDDHLKEIERKDKIIFSLEQRVKDTETK